MLERTLQWGETGVPAPLLAENSSCAKSSYWLVIPMRICLGLVIQVQQNWPIKEAFYFFLRLILSAISPFDRTLVWYFTLGT